MVWLQGVRGYADSKGYRRSKTDDRTRSERCKSWPIWTCEPSTFDWSYTEKETCLILEGEVTVSDGKESVSFGPGDLVIFPQDLDCVWSVEKAGPQAL